MQRSKSERIIPDSLYKPKRHDPKNIGQEEHLTDYYGLIDKRQKNKKQKKDKNKKHSKNKDIDRCLTIGSAQDHSKSLSKLQENISALNKQKVDQILENQKLKDSIVYMTNEIMIRPRNQIQYQYAYEILQRAREIKHLKQKIEQENKKYKNSQKKKKSS